MTILLVLIPLGVVLLAIAIAFFVWAVRNGQFEDLEGEAERILYDEEPLPDPTTSAASDRAMKTKVARRGGLPR